METHFGRFQKITKLYKAIKGNMIREERKIAIKLKKTEIVISNSQIVKNEVNK